MNRLFRQPVPRLESVKIGGSIAILGCFGALFGCGGEGTAPGVEGNGDYRHVLLISLDTTRADAIGAYGGLAAKTPRLDALANSGVRFADVTSAAPTTLASHTTIMTGLYPRRHGVARNGFMISPDNIMLAEVLQQAGFHTAGFIGSFALDQVFEFNQGFDHWDQTFSVDFDPRTADQNQRSAGEVTDSVLDYVGSFDGTDRLFLFAHYFDVHAPYAPPEPFASEYAERWKVSDFGLLQHQITKHQEELIGKTRDVYRLGLSKALAAKATGESLPGDSDMAALYAGELAYLDAEVGRLLDGLDSKGILENAIVVLTSDHGETFWEHGDFWAHGAWVYQTNVHVPLIVRLPDGRAAGRVVNDPTSTVDIFPTLLDLLGLPLPEPVAGLSLVPTFDGRSLGVRNLFSEATQPTGTSIEQDFGWENQLKTKSIRRGKWKYIQAPYLRYQELYNLETDPEERHNLMDGLSPEHGNVVSGLRKSLDAWRMQVNPRETAFNSSQMDVVLQKLKDLGYTGTEPEDPAGAEIPDQEQE
ncbi:MAG: choline-sulfatase [Candidatus Paceibacteria bacterium]|jgi:choline-sulfatase